MDLRKILVWVSMAIVLMAMVACGSNSSNDDVIGNNDEIQSKDNELISEKDEVVADNPPPKAVPSGLSPTLISTTSIETDSVALDGQWLTWTGVDRQGIYISDGLETKNQTDNLAVEYYPKEVAFDGRFTAFFTQSQKQLFVVDNQDTESIPVLIADSTDRIEGFHIDQGELVWVDNADDILYYVDLDSGSQTPTAITDGAIRKMQCKVDNGLIVWVGSVDTGSDTHWRVFYYDLKSPAPTIVQPSGQTNYDHWMVSVHDQFIAWQGSDAGLDTEIFYCDLRQDPLAAVQLTDNATDDRHPQVENKIIVWDGSIASESAISYIDMNDSSPSIDQLATAALYDSLGHFRDGVIAWTASTGSFRQIFFYDLNDSPPEIVKLTDDGFHNLQPQVANGQIVWITREADGGQILAHELVSSLTDQVANLPHSEIMSVLCENDYHVWLSRGLNKRVYAQPADGNALNPVPVTPPDVDVGSLQLDNGIAVLRAFDGNYFQIYYCDLNADDFQLVKLSYNDNNNGYPQIQGSIAVWDGKTAAGVDQVFYADLSSASPAGVAIGVDEEFNHQCAVHDGIITWLGGIYPNYEVYYYDLNASSPQAVNLTSNAIWETEPKTNQGIVAWSRQNTGNFNDVWYYDLDADGSLERQVTNSGGSDDRIKAISDRVLVWISNDREIFFYDLNSISPTSEIVAADGEWKGGLSFDGGKLVWNAFGEIHAYDIFDSDPTQIQITDNEFNDFGPKIKGEFIVWEGDGLTYAARW